MKTLIHASSAALIVVAGAAMAISGCGAGMDEDLGGGSKRSGDESIGQVSAALTYDLLWADEFGESYLNRNNWSVAGPDDACFNNECQAYVDHEDCGNSQHTLCVSGGSLHIVARKVPVSPVYACGGQQRWYRSARLTTKTHHSFHPWQGTNGIRIEARIRLPTIIPGSWPAFWMLGDDLNQWPGSGSNFWPEAGEIDIMEMGSTWSYDKAIGSLHYGAGTYSSYDGDQHVNVGPGYTASFNEHEWRTYAVDWTPTQMTWYMNGAQFYSVNLTTLGGDQDFDHGFNILLNFALGGAGGNNLSDPSPDPINGAFPNNGMNYTAEQEMAIDYVRVYAINSGSTIPDGDYRIHTNNGKCVGIAYNGVNDGDNIRQWDCGGLTGQWWNVVHKGNGEYELKNFNSNKCMDLDGGGTTAGTNIHQWSCLNNTNQRFRIEDQGGGNYFLRPVGTNMCASLESNSTANGANIRQWYCDGTPQHFTFERVVTNGEYKIHTNNGKCVGIAGNGVNDGDNVRQWTCQGLTGQRWNVTEKGNSEYEIKNYNSGKCMDLDAGGTTAGTNIQQWSCATTTNQRFKIEHQGGGEFFIRPVATNLCASLENNSTADGANIRQWYCDGEPQLFTFE